MRAQMVGFITKTQAAHGVTGSTSLLNFVVTDGSTLIATRFVSPDSDKPASLYYAEGSTFRCARSRPSRTREECDFAAAALRALSRRRGRDPPCRSPDPGSSAGPSTAARRPARRSTSWSSRSAGRGW